MANRTVLIHLHPDFEELLSPILTKWNKVQQQIKFVGIKPKREDEINLITAGRFRTEKLFSIVDEIRQEKGYSPREQIIAFTEKKISDRKHAQLYVSCTSADEDPPNTTLVSLDFARKTFQRIGDDKNIVFQTIISNVLYSVAQSDGFDTHDDTRGCPLDFCNNMIDIVENIKNEFRFCSEHVKEIKKNKKGYLLDLSEAVKGYSKPSAKSKAVSERMLSTKKARLDPKAKFNYDIALSYAGPDRSRVDQVAKALAGNDVNVFYDQFEKANLWGKDLSSHLTDVYMRAKFCVIFISKHYAKRYWTNRERIAAQRRAARSKKEYILPVRFDNTKVKGILPSVAFLNWPPNRAKDVTDLLMQKLK